MNLSGIERQGTLMYQFNGMVENEQAFGLELYETPFRSYDAQLGRFWQVDALADQLHGTSVFQFAYNNPISLNDPTGLKPSDKHLKKEDIEYTYSFDEGSWLNSSGQQVSASEAMGWVHGSYLWDNRDDVLTLSGDIMVKALSLMGEGEITNFAISQGKGRGEVARITYEHKAQNGQRSLVGISLKTNDGDGDRASGLPDKIRDGIVKIIDKTFPIVIGGLKRTTVALEYEGSTLMQSDGTKAKGINFQFAIPTFNITVKSNVTTLRARVGLDQAEWKTEGYFNVTGGGLKAGGFGLFIFGEKNNITKEMNNRLILNGFGGFIEFSYIKNKGLVGIIGMSTEGGGAGLIPYKGFGDKGIKLKGIASFRFLGANKK